MEVSLSPATLTSGRAYDYCHVAGFSGVVSKKIRLAAANPYYYSTGSHLRNMQLSIWQETSTAKCFQTHISRARAWTKGDRHQTPRQMSTMFSIRLWLFWGSLGPDHQGFDTHPDFQTPDVIKWTTGFYVDPHAPSLEHRVPLISTEYVVYLLSFTDSVHKLLFLVLTMHPVDIFLQFFW